MQSLQELKMGTYLETVQQHNEAQVANKLAQRDIIKAQVKTEWIERLSPLEDRLAKLLANIPSDIKDQGLSLTALRGMLAGKWRGRCHPGDLGVALRKLGYQRRRKWSDGTHSFSALWFPRNHM
jgi:1,2-phenylacetyl-CoA epoxidase catalytic subunit